MSSRSVKLANIFNPLLQKGLFEVANSKVNTVASVKPAITAAKIITSMNSGASQNFKNVNGVGLKVNVEYLYFSVISVL